MAILTITYGNASLSKKIEIQYNDVTHTIVSGTILPGTIAPYLPFTAGTTFYTQDGVGYKYRLKVQNTAPYAYVDTSLEFECEVSIDSVSIDNASTNQSADGSIVITASGNGTRSFRIDELGSSFQDSNTFNNLPAGTYHVTVKQRGISFDFCYDTQEVVVGYDNVVCELELGTIEVIKANGVSDGQINIITVVDPIGLELEYRLDAGAWQASASFTGLTAGTYNVQVRYKNFTGCIDNRNVDVNNLVTCDARITGAEIVHEQAKYADDGVITINATSTHTPILYSINNGGSYQAGNSFQGLSPGVYVLRIQDDEGCEDSLTVEVFKFKSPYLEVPVVNSHRFVVTDGPMVQPLQNFDNRLLDNFNMPGVSVCKYRQKFKLADVVTTQFRSSYSTNTLKLYTEAGVLTATLTPIKKTSNLNKTALHEDILFADAGASQVQVFFPNGLPDYFEVGQDVTVSGLVSLNGTYEIKDIRAGTVQAVGYTVLIIDKVWPGGTTLQADLSIIYDAELFDIYEVTGIYSLYAAGRYYFILEGSDVQFADYSARSEPFETATAWEGTMQVDYYNFEDAYKIQYSTGIRHRIHIEGYLDWPKPGGERTVHQDSQNRLRKLQENVTRNPDILVEALPAYLLERLALIFGHDFFSVDEIEYQTEEDFEPEYFEADALGNGRVKLRQVEFLAENTDDAGDVDATVLDVNDDLMAVEP